MARKTRISPLQGLRALAFIGIFAEHAGLSPLGGWGVSCFLILSGFLMYYNYRMRGGIGDCGSVKDNIIFAIKKIRKLYPLHCITLMMTMIVYWDNQRLDSARHILIWGFKVLANLLLLQSCIPKSEFYFSFNAVSWYLSTAFVLYFAFPYIWRVVNRIRNRYGVIVQFVIIIAIQSTISALFLIYSDQISNIPVTISDDLTKYVTYICPLYRMGDFYIGCLLGYVFLHSDFNIETKIIVNVIEILPFLAIGFLQLIYRRQIGFLGEDAFRYTLLYTLDAILLVYIIGCRKGFLSKRILSSKPMVFIGDLSGYAFLIHPLIVGMIYKVFNERSTIIIILSFLLTIVFAYILMNLSSKILEVKRLKICHRVSQ